MTDPLRIHAHGFIEAAMEELMAIDNDELNTRFTYHPPKGDQGARYVTIRDAASEYAAVIAKLTPESREQSLAITHLEQSVMWANAAIARRE